MTIMTTAWKLVLAAAILGTTAVVAAPAQAQQPRRSFVEYYTSPQAFEQGRFAQYEQGNRVVDFDTCYNFSDGAQSWIVVYHHKDFPASGPYDHFVQASNWNEFNAEVGRVALEGWRVDDMDTSGHPPTGVVTHTAILNPAEGSQFLINQSDWAAFEQARLSHHASGLRLVDIDVASVRGVQRFYGVMRPGTQDEQVVRENSLSDFNERRQLLAAQGWRLIDFGIAANVVVGVFNRGEGAYAFLDFNNWAAVEQRVRLFENRNMILTDIECRLEGTNIRYTGLWRAVPRPPRPSPFDNARPPTGGTVERSPGH